MVYDPVRAVCWYWDKTFGSLWYFDGTNWFSALSSYFNNSMTYFPLIDSLVFSGGDDNTTFLPNMYVPSSNPLQPGLHPIGTEFPPHMEVTSEWNGLNVLMTATSASVSSPILKYYMWDGQHLGLASVALLGGPPTSDIMVSHYFGTNPIAGNVYVYSPTIGGHIYRRPPSQSFQHLTALPFDFVPLNRSYFYSESACVESCYDPYGDRFILAGKSHPNGPWIQSYSLGASNSSLQSLSPASRMTPADDFALAFDIRRNVPILYGQTALHETFIAELQGAQWVERYVGAPLLAGPSLVYDRARGGILLAGGMDQNTWNPNHNVWLWDGQFLTLVDTLSVPPWMGFPKVLDVPERSEIWFVDPDTNTLLAYGLCGSSVAFGLGCTGSHGRCVLNGISRPQIGQSMSMQTTGLPPGVPVACGVGLSDSTWGGLALPLDLGLAGAPGCSLYCSLDLTSLALTDGSGAAIHSISIPNSISLVGVSLFAQSLGLDAVNALGIVTSNALRQSIGNR